jgi:hypothetical protein
LKNFIEPVMGESVGNNNYVKIIPNTISTNPTLAEHSMPRIAYMAHHDTVHTQCGMQNDNLLYIREPLGDTTKVIVFAQNKVKTETKLVTTKKWDPILKQLNDVEELKEFYTNIGFYSNCLGADCTTGVWLILEMIKANVPGVYVIHSDEEVGGKGARDMVNAHIKIKNDINNCWSKTLVGYDIR